MYWKVVNILIVHNQHKTPGHLKICHSVHLINLWQPQLRMVKLLQYDAIVLFSTRLICRMINVGIARLQRKKC